MEIENWATHLDVIVPGIIFIGKVLIGVIVAGFGCLCSVIGWVGRGFGKRFEAMELSVKNMHDVMLGCDGCKNSLEKFGRRKEDQ